MILSTALAHGWPDAQWSLTGNDYSTLIWHGPGDKPTLAEIETAWEASQAVMPPVTMRALQFALAQAGLYAAVKAAATSTEAGEIWWTTSLTVRRDHPFVAQLALGQTDEQIDAIFAAAQASNL